ncbi:MAG: carbamoyltransferase C-terminal domain-containing protein, partial [Candidatus Parabeggiatoa sp.]|nr:carbamoyltransferase C-terminal domain-containing protein [Candidatus Parabeggiatoa sp.]
TYFTGFKVNSGEYKLMGLAPYGEPKYVQTILDNLIDLKEDGTFQLNMRYFNYAVGLTMTNREFDKLFDGPPRPREGRLTQREMDIARSIQAVTEEVVLRLSRTVHKELAVDYLCLAGGVALNCVANGRILRENLFKAIWIQPAAGDAGGALGAAFSVWHEYLDKPRTQNTSNPSLKKEERALADSMQGAYLGPQSSETEIRTYLESINAPYDYLPDEELLPKLAKILADENVIGWFQGRMEFGPRALGGRSILGDPRSTKMQSVMNRKIKYRESFRPFAPSVLHDRVSDYFELDCASPYMLLVADVKPEFRLPLTAEQQDLFGIEKLNVPRSKLPAITHLDYSARIQTVHPDTNPRYYALLKEFETLTGCPVIVNTSFNVRGEPLVCTPLDAYQCFMRTEMDYLVLENVLLSKHNQPKWLKDEAWKQEFELD